MRIPEVARGNWRSLLPELGVDARFLTGKHTSCPLCGGLDRFRFDDQHGLGGWICNACGAGDGFALAMKVNGISFRDLSDRIAKLMGVINTPEERKLDLAEERQRIAMQSVWDNAGQPSEGSPVGRYLKSRIGLPWSSKAIRQANDNPVMVSKVTGADGKPVNLHLTYLTLDGRKAAVVPCRRVMAGKLPDGCAIRLSPPAPIMGVAEGIETAISAAIMFDMPVWACINAGLLAKWTPPDIAEEIHIFGDNDLNYCGQAAAYRLANRLTVQCKRIAHVVIPIFPGTDWNDKLNGV